MGNWNCVRAEGSTCFYFATTINVLEGLFGYAKRIGGREELETAQTSARNIFSSDLRLVNWRTRTFLAHFLRHDGDVILGLYNTYAPGINLILI